MQLACATSFAQTGGQGRPGGFDAGLTAEVTYADIKGTTASDKGSGVMGRLAPSIRWRSNTSWLTGSVEYSVQASYYARFPGNNHIDNSLDATFLAEAVRNFLFVDLRANISQQALSVLGPQADPEGVAVNPNLTEVYNTQVSPYVRTNLGTFADFEARYSAGFTRGRNTSEFDTTNNSTSVELRSRSSPSLLGWSLQASHQRIDYEAGRPTDTTRLAAGLQFKPYPDLLFNLRAGQEETDAAGLISRRFDTWGAGVNWKPTERTLAKFEYDHRYFGNSYQAVLEHRWRHLLFRFAAGRDLNSGFANTLGQPVTLYALYFTQFASAFPDPALRDVQVREYLRLLGLDPKSVVAQSSLTAATTLVRRQDLSMVYTGLRNVASIQVYTSNSNVIDEVSPSSDTEATRRQWGVSASVSHRLSPRTSLSMTASKYRASAGTVDSDADSTSVGLSLSSAITERASAAFSARHTRFDNSLPSSYRESSYTASLSLRF